MRTLRSVGAENDQASGPVASMAMYCAGWVEHRLPACATLELRPAARVGLVLTAENCADAPECEQRTKADNVVRVNNRAMDCTDMRLIIEKVFQRRPAGIHRNQLAAGPVY